MILYLVISYAEYWVKRLASEVVTELAQNVAAGKVNLADMKNIFKPETDATGERQRSDVNITIEDTSKSQGKIQKDSARVIIPWLAVLSVVAYVMYTGGRRHNEAVGILMAVVTFALAGSIMLARYLLYKLTPQPANPNRWRKIWTRLTYITTGPIMLGLTVIALAHVVKFFGLMSN